MPLRVLPARTLPPQRCGACRPWAESRRGGGGTSASPPASSLAIEQRANVLEQLVGTDRAVAVVTDEAADHLVRLLELLGVRCLRRGRDLDHITQVGEELLLDRLLQPLMAGVVKGLPPAGQ